MITLNDLPDMSEYMGKPSKEKKVRKWRMASVLVNLNEPPIIVDFVDYAQGLTEGQVRCHIHEAREEGYNYIADLLEFQLDERKYCKF